MTAVAETVRDEDLVRAMVQQIPEVADGVVRIVSIARCGERAKIAVRSAKAGVDAAALCIGVGGGRIHGVEALLGGGRVSIVAFDQDPRCYIRNALDVEVDSIALDRAEGAARVVVDRRDFRTAIGKAGLNVRLAGWLTGWHIQLCTSQCRGTRHVHPRVFPSSSASASEEFGS